MKHIFLKGYTEYKQKIITTNLKSMRKKKREESRGEDDGR